ncbi:MAG: uroporphyrinogen-III C-methyltransferase [Dehalococcoidia bacterium]
MADTGTVYLVGAGPGDPGLITVKGLECLRRADVVVYDRLASPRLLSEARQDAELVDAGKGRGSQRLTQEEINCLLVKYAREGKTVCRLKGGDPFVFGRGGEEAIELAAAGIEWEVVPGVTSAIAAAAYAGIPVTHRGLATSFTVVTGSEDPSKQKPGEASSDSTVDWDALSRMQGTLIFLMGWEGLPKIVDALVERGVPANRPAALVRWGTTSRQRTVSGTLENIVTRGRDAGLGPPVAFIVGDVAGLRDSLAWFDQRPLFGKRVLVTRARTQASRLVKILESYGAETVEFPAIRVEPLADPSQLDDALKRLHEYDWVTFTSSNSARGVATRLEALGMDARSFHGVNVAAVGPSTAAAVKEIGIRPDLVPDQFVAEAVVAEFERRGYRPRRVLALRSNIGRETLPEGLRNMGAQVDEVVAYETKAPQDSAEMARAAYAEEQGGIDVTTFTSSSGVTNLLNLLDGDAGVVNSSTVACIGPITAEAARGLGVRVDIVGNEQTIDGLVKAVLEYTERQANS